MLRPGKIFLLIAFFGLSNFVWGDIKVTFTPSLATTYTTNSNVFTEKEEPQFANSYELVPSARLSAVFGKRFRASLLYRFSSSQYLSPTKSELEDKAEDRGIDRDSVVEFRSSSTSLNAEYGFSRQFSADINVRYKVNGLPSYESSYYQQVGVEPGVWYNPAKTTSFHLTYIYNSFDYPLKEITDSTVPQRDIETGGSLLAIHQITKSTRVGITYEHTTNNSNDNLWDYESDNEYLNLWQNFGKNVTLQVTGHWRQRQYRTYQVPEENTERTDFYGGLYNY